MRSATATKFLIGFAAALVAVAAWYYLAPAALGGSTTYVVTDGVSMEPAFHGGDLVAVRSQSSYHVGEIVAYRSRLLHTIVLHRIVGRDGSAYLFKGDNNRFIDPEHPLRGQLVGALWLHIPAVGGILESLRSPPAVGGLVGVGALLLGGGAFAGTRRRRRRRRSDIPGSQPPRRRLPRRPRPVGSIIAVGLVALLPFVLLALLSYTRPTTGRFAFSVPYRQSGSFSYTAAASPSPVYPKDRAVTGSPLFTRVLHAVDVSFAYSFRAHAAHSISGNVSLAATVSSTSGWQEMLPLERSTPFHGDHAVARATLNVRSLTSTINAVEAATSVTGQYTLTLTPHIVVYGSLHGVPLRTTYAPALPFTLSQFELQQSGAAAATGLGVPAPKANPLDPSASGSVIASVVKPLKLSFAFASLTVGRARSVSLYGLVVLVLALLAALAAGGRRSPDELAAIRRRYGRWIVPVAAVTVRPELPTVDVASIDQLAQIAERYDRVILHETGTGVEAFWVADESAQYRYRLATATVEEPAAAAAEPVAAEPEGDLEEEPLLEGDVVVAGSAPLPAVIPGREIAVTGGPVGVPVAAPAPVWLTASEGDVLRYADQRAMALFGFGVLAVAAGLVSGRGARLRGRSYSQA